MKFPRESGVLLHPTSLPGPHGIGDLGDDAFRFVEWLERAGQRLWQVMPLNPTGFGDSPYSSPSAFAGNPLLISLAWLQGDGLLAEEDLRDTPDFSKSQVDFGAVVPFKTRLLHVAYERFREGAAAFLLPEFNQFCLDEAEWLDDYALFVATKEAHGGVAWRDWEHDISLRAPSAVAAWTQRLAHDIRYHKFVQFLVGRQWQEVRRYANDRGIRIVGDVPIFVADDSADVWTNRSQFKLDSEGRAVDVAGVPPDPFSATGQIWGNPVYDWREMSKDGYHWWRRRAAALLKQVDIIRIDHFRGFAAAWLVPADAETAASGHWELAPGADVFAAILREAGDVPIIVEDLGVITPDVISLREILGLPGMKVLQFAFDGDPENVYLPHNYTADAVVYTATHDNQTTIGWFTARSDEDRNHVLQYLGTNGEDIAWDMIRVALASAASTVILALQDILRLDDAARMNVPGQAIGNWSWRYETHELDPLLADGLHLMCKIYSRTGDGLKVTREPNPWDYTQPGSQLQAINPFVE